MPDVGCWMLATAEPVHGGGGPDVRYSPAAPSQLFHRREDRFRFHHHPLPSTKWRIIDDVMLVGCPIAQIVNVEIDNFIFLRSLHHALVERRAADFWKQSQDVDFHERRTFNVQRSTSNVECL